MTALSQSIKAELSLLQPADVLGNVAKANCNAGHHVPQLRHLALDAPRSRGAYLHNLRAFRRPRPTLGMPQARLSTAAWSSGPLRVLERDDKVQHGGRLRDRQFQINLCRVGIFHSGNNPQQRDCQSSQQGTDVLLERAHRRIDAVRDPTHQHEAARVDRFLR
jgi:hypothetical protein